MSRNNIATGANSATLMLDFSYYYSGTAGDSLKWYQPGTVIGRGFIYTTAYGFADSFGGGGGSLVNGENTKLIYRVNNGLASTNFFKNGASGGTGSSGTAWTGINTLELNSTYGSFRFRNIFMASTALTDSQCINLTTINE